jgi:hypothetical protein
MMPPLLVYRDNFLLKGSYLFLFFGRFGLWSGVCGLADYGPVLHSPLGTKEDCRSAIVSTLPLDYYLQRYILKLLLAGGKRQ